MRGVFVLGFMPGSDYKRADADKLQLCSKSTYFRWIE
jgi:hypothetical protein